MIFGSRIWLYIAGAAGIFMLTFLLVRCADRSMESATTQARDAGASQQRADDLTETFNRTKEANNAAEAVRRDPAARHAGCVRGARNPENCD